ncbi:hypothetical protein GCM10028798_11510 [Humibacter antri]
MPRAPLPRSLGSEFSVTLAASEGVTPARLRAGDLDAPFFGVRAVPRTDRVADGAAVGARANERRILALARARASRMTEHEFFSHVTAAVLWGAPLPPYVVESGPIHVSVYSPRRAPRGRGVIGHEVAPSMAGVRVLESPIAARITDPATTWAMLGGIVAHPYDLVAVADAFVRIQRRPGGIGPRPRAPLATLDELTHAMRCGRRAGALVLRDALPRIRTGSSSRTETWTRLVLVDAGLPEPELDVDVYDEHGRFVACVDMAYPLQKIAIEYDGSQHRTDAAQWESDVDRIDRLAACGWRVIRVTRRLLFVHPQELVRRVRRELDARR